MDTPLKAPRPWLSPRKVQRVGFNLLGAVSILTVCPFWGWWCISCCKGAPAISWEFPGRHAAAMGCARAASCRPSWARFYLTLGTAIFSMPLGMAAAIYLAEYAADNSWTRLIRLAIINLAGIPSVVYGLFGLGLFVLFFKFGTSILAASLTLSIMTLPVIISTTRRSAAQRAAVLRMVGISLGATQLADHPAHRAAAGAAGHHHRHHPGPGARRRRDRTDPVHRRGLLPAAPAHIRPWTPPWPCPTISS